MTWGSSLWTINIKSEKRTTVFVNSNWIIHGYCLNHARKLQMKIHCDGLDLNTMRITDFNILLVSDLECEHVQVWTIKKYTSTLTWIFPAKTTTKYIFTDEYLAVISSTHCKNSITDKPFRFHITILAHGSWVGLFTKSVPLHFQDFSGDVSLYELRLFLATDDETFRNVSECGLLSAGADCWGCLTAL